MQNGNLYNYSKNLQWSFFLLKLTVHWYYGFLNAVCCLWNEVSDMIKFLNSSYYLYSLLSKLVFFPLMALIWDCDHFKDLC